MKPLTKLYLRTFLITGIPFGLITIAFDWLNGGEFSLLKFLFMTFFFGVFMSLILVSAHVKRLRKNGIHELTEKNLRVTQTKEIKTRLKMPELIKRLKTNPTIDKMKMTETEDGIILNTSKTWKSWGEEIKIVLKSEIESEFEYQISSRPKLKSILVDYGNNIQNLNQIENAIK